MICHIILNSLNFYISIILRDHSSLLLPHESFDCGLMLILVVAIPAVDGLFEGARSKFRRIFAAAVLEFSESVEPVDCSIVDCLIQVVASIISTMIAAAKD